MVASTDIKFYVHSNNNAPQLQNAYGSMIGVLDACLVNGLTLGPVATLTAVGTTVTAVFSAAHNLMQYQVLKIKGANQAEYNGEHRILTVPNATSVTFQLASAPNVTTATGTISASLPPLGWEKPFSSANVNGGGKAAYRSKNLLLPSRPFLRVVDELDPAYTATYAKYAKVGIVEEMTDINTMLGVQAPYDSASPDKNWVGSGSSGAAINGWARWYYARLHDEQTAGAFNDSYPPQAGLRKYIIVGNQDYFYLIPSIAMNNFGYLYGFGEFKSLLAADNSNNFLASTLNYSEVSNTTYPAQYNALGNNVVTTLLLQRDTTQVVSSNASCVSIGNRDAVSGTNIFGSTGSNNVVTSAQVLIKEADSGNLRGELSGLRWLFQSFPYSDMEIVATSTQAFIALHVNNNINNTRISGQVLLNIGEL